jgi:sugar O-acyltransferase (sialic acid O-acetyltransferase NeuD family)
VLDKKSILIGYSGHALVVAETAIDNNLNLIGYAEKNLATNNPFQLDYLGFENEENFIGWTKEASYVLGIGDNNLRQKVAHLIESKGKNIETVIHNSASISKTVTIGVGTFINRNVAINAFAKIGKYVILNTACIIEHECVLADAVHIAPGAVLAGNVTVGERTFIGANAVVKQGIAIGKDVIIGAGSVIINDIPDGKKVVGNPNRII